MQSGQIIQQVLQADRFIIQAGQQVAGKLRILVGAVQQGLDGRADGAQRTTQLVDQVGQ